MGMTVGGANEYNSEINVTPMVDVMLVLLIIFMVVTPLLQQDVNVNFPKDMNMPEEDADISKDDAIVVNIPDDSNFFLGKVQYPLDELGEKIGNMVKEKTPDKRIVYVKGGIDVEYGTIVKAIDQIRKQDIDKIGLIADKKKATQAQQ